MVSIPFKRERASQQGSNIVLTTENVERFPFPSNGIARLKTSREGSLGRGHASFHSLQTGARVSTPGKKWYRPLRRSVSIPFKRDSASQRQRQRRSGSTGAVSIPFKRDSASQQELTVETINTLMSFPFPSNGIAHLNREKLTSKEKRAVFPFPSNGSAHLNDLIAEVQDGSEDEFPFPSNGIARLNIA